MRRFSQQKKLYRIVERRSFEWVDAEPKHIIIDGEHFVIEGNSLNSSQVQKARALAAARALRIHPVHRIQSWQMYLSGGSDYGTARVILALQELAAELRMTPLQIVEVDPGSVFARFVSRFKRGVTSEDARVFADQVRQTAEAMTVDKALAENAEHNANAIATLLSAASEADSASFDLETVQIAMYTDENGKKHMIGRSKNSRHVGQDRITSSLREPRALFEELSAIEPGEG